MIHKCVRLRRVGLAMVGLSLAVGCGFNSGLLQDTATGNQIQLRMDVVSERYSRTVAGSSYVGAILCFLPIDTGLYDQAMRSLHEHARLQANEVLQNVRVDNDPTCYLLFGVHRVTISADVYDVTPAGETPPPSQGAAAPPAKSTSSGRRCLDDGSCDVLERCAFPVDAGVGAIGHCVEAR